MVVSLANIQADIGELYDEVNGGTTSVSSIITRSANFVKLVTGTTTGFDEVIRPLADANVVNQMFGSIDPINKTISSLSVGDKDIKSMQRYFENEAKTAAKIMGYSLDGLRIIFEDSAQ